MKFAILLGTAVGFISRSLGIGSGNTWSGELALRIYPTIMEELSAKLSKTILVVGTNGKTTTSAMIAHILKTQGIKVIHNATGANLLNGIASALLTIKSFDKSDRTWGVFEVDEAALPKALKKLKPDAVVLLNLFRDQLDRYGEVDIIALKWNKALKLISNNMVLVANADDPLIAWLGKGYHGKTVYFGIKKTNIKKNKLSYATDSTFCMDCGNKLAYRSVYLSHCGDWSCTSCGIKRPNIDLSEALYPLKGIYNEYNSLAAMLVLTTFGFPKARIQGALKTFTPAFGRQEKIIVDNKAIKLLLSKNPTGFNASLGASVFESKTSTALFVLNDRIPDGLDVSWIWDVDFEKYVNLFDHIICTGERARDMGLRIKYAGKVHYTGKVDIEENLQKALRAGLEKTKPGETLYIFPTYSAMLEVRKLLTGARI